MIPRIGVAKDAMPSKDTGGGIQENEMLYFKYSYAH